MAKAEKKDGIWETVKTIFWALVIAGIFRTLFFQPFYIPSGSMKDTLLIGDFLFVNKMAYGYSQYSCPFSMCPIEGRILGSQPERGDVVVFRHPTRGVDYIKRVVGLPGDTVQMTEGRLIINGEPAEYEKMPDFVEPRTAQRGGTDLPLCTDLSTPEGGPCHKERFTETLPGGEGHSVLNAIDGLTQDDTKLFTVPEGEYFFVGDNRDNSLDSRFSKSRGGLGFVADEYLIGRADRVLFSSAGRSLLYVWTWRPDRFFKAIR
ncbi:signal peptidase I [Paracoccus sediminicola]|uniref:signal peptidase I n=1 Tax=Paracoccus sediminicola TaxID=3017783 RepID=UPI0022F067EC|nr:signal peptidase I [Paracoccus sediminicola]WBU56783.1 signal peptidase I [Paracoccus sediminicola]